MTYPSQRTQPMTATLEAASGDTQAVIEAARQGLVPKRLDLGAYYAVATANGDVKLIDLTGDKHREYPVRKQGTVKVSDADSFLAYYGKHSNPGSEVYADPDKHTITAVLDAHTADEARWSEHRVVLALRYSSQFQRWLSMSGKMTGQTDFADFIEENRPAVVDPPAADLIELAQFFQATTNITFKSGSVLKNGQRTLNYTEHIDAHGGKNGQLEIPDRLTLALQIFEGDESAEEFTARLRYRTPNGQLTLGVVLDDVEDKVRAAFTTVVDVIGDGIDTATGVMYGTPIGA